MTSNLELANRILTNRFHNPRILDPRSLQPATASDQDHEALATAIALTIEHLQRQHPNPAFRLDEDECID